MPSGEGDDGFARGERLEILNGEVQPVGHQIALA